MVFFPGCASGLPCVHSTVDPRNTSEPFKFPVVLWFCISLYVWGHAHIYSQWSQQEAVCWCSVMPQRWPPPAASPWPPPQAQLRQTRASPGAASPDSAVTVRWHSPPCFRARALPTVTAHSKQVPPAVSPCLSPFSWMDELFQFVLWLW